MEPSSRSSTWRLSNSQLPVLLEGFRTVFGRPLLLLLAVAVAATALVLTTWLPNLALVWKIVLSESVSMSDKARILAALAGSLVTNFTGLTAAATVVISGLFGANVAAITYLLRQRRSVLTSSKSATASLVGLVSGVAGMGCAACGTLVLGPLLSFLGGATLASLLPFAGEEFSLLGIALLATSLVVTLRRIAQPVSCPIARAP